MINSKKSSQYSRFAIIHHFNSPNSAVTVDGKEVRREDRVWYAEYDDEGKPYAGRFVGCCQYDNHFVYIDPMWKKIRGRWFSLCSCGSPAVIVGYNAYQKDASPNTDSMNKGEMLVCYHHISFGRHADGSS